mgnify:CR=1 FL=1
MPTMTRRIRTRPLDYFKMFYGDTSVNGSAPAIRCGLDFFGADRVLFGTDCPFDPEGGPTFIRESIRAIDSLKLAEAVRSKIYFGNAQRMLRLAPAASSGAKAAAKRRKK